MLKHKPLYITIVRANVEGFEMDVNAKIAEGYKPYGSMSIEMRYGKHTYYVQPMTLQLPDLEGV